MVGMVLLGCGQKSGEEGLVPELSVGAEESSSSWSSDGGGDVVVRVGVDGDPGGRFRHFFEQRQLIQWRRAAAHSQLVRRRSWWMMQDANLLQEQHGLVVSATEE